MPTRPIVLVVMGTWCSIGLAVLAWRLFDKAERRQVKKFGPLKVIVYVLLVVYCWPAVAGAGGRAEDI